MKIRIQENRSVKICGLSNVRNERGKRKRGRRMKGTVVPLFRRASKSRIVTVIERMSAFRRMSPSTPIFLWTL